MLVGWSGLPGEAAGLQGTGGAGIGAAGDRADGRHYRGWTVTGSFLPVQANVAPLFEVRLELYRDDLRYHPSLEVGAENGFLELVESLTNDIYEAARFIPRLAHGKQSYKVRPSASGSPSQQGPCDPLAHLGAGLHCRGGSTNWTEFAAWF